MVMHLPIGLEDAFEGVIDLITMETIRWGGEYGEDVIRAPLDESDPLYELAVEGRENLAEAVGEADDEVMDAYLEVGPSEITVDMMRAGIRRATLANKGVAVLCGSALKNKGVQLLLDGIVDYLPNPLEIHNHAFDDHDAPACVGRSRELPVDAAYLLGVMLRDGLDGAVDARAARRWLERAASAGHAEAEAALRR